MSQIAYRYEFDVSIAVSDVEAALLSALLAVESLHGEARVRLDAGHCIDTERRVCVIDAATPVGQAINQIFTGALRRELGEHAFRVHRIDTSKAASARSPSAMQEDCREAAP